MNDSLLAELARRELARRYYGEYLAYSYGDDWVRTRLSSYLAEKIQTFIETDTGYAYRFLNEEAANGPAIFQTLQREMFIIPARCGRKNSGGRFLTLRDYLILMARSEENKKNGAFQPRMSCFMNQSSYSA
jgi:hypothetical protein